MEKHQEQNREWPFVFCLLHSEMSKFMTVKPVRSDWYQVSEHGAELTINNSNAVLDIIPCHMNIKSSCEDTELCLQGAL